MENEKRWRGGDKEEGKRNDVRRREAGRKMRSRSMN